MSSKFSGLQKRSFVRLTPGNDQKLVEVFVAQTILEFRRVVRGVHRVLVVSVVDGAVGVWRNPHALFDWRKNGSWKESFKYDMFRLWLRKLTIFVGVKCLIIILKTPQTLFALLKTTKCIFHRLSLHWVSIRLRNRATEIRPMIKVTMSRTKCPKIEERIFMFYKLNYRGRLWKGEQNNIFITKLNVSFYIFLHPKKFWYKLTIIKSNLYNLWKCWKKRAIVQ